MGFETVLPCFFVIPLDVSQSLVRINKCFGRRVGPQAGRRDVDFSHLIFWFR